MNVAYEGLEVVHIAPEYPNSLDPLVIKAVTGKENPPDVGIVGIHTLWGLGRVVVTGMPLTETVVTLGSRTHTGNYIIKNGTRVCDLIAHANVKVNPGDTVVVGGPLRGQSISLLARGLDKNTTGLFTLEADTIPPLDGDVQCCNCGSMLARVSRPSFSRDAQPLCGICPLRQMRERAYRRMYGMRSVRLCLSGQTSRTAIYSSGKAQACA